MSLIALDELVSRFCAATLPHAEWTHTAHLRAGTWHVHRHGPDQALPLLRERIRKLNDHHGTPNSPTRGYHETITAAYVALIAEHLATFEDSVPLEARVAALLERPVASKEALLRFWSRALLLSPRARAEWVPPDLAPLALSALRNP
jgi:hypothetical protein